jgi:hypothetical protein
MLMRSLIPMLISFPTLARAAQSNQSGYGQNNPQQKPQVGTQPIPDTACPWLTEGSAAKALGSNVSVTASVPNTDEGSCKFARQQAPLGTLEILVDKNSLPSCPPTVSSWQESGRCVRVADDSLTFFPSITKSAETCSSTSRFESSSVSRFVIWKCAASQIAPGMTAKSSSSGGHFDVIFRSPCDSGLFSAPFYCHG